MATVPARSLSGSGSSNDLPVRSSTSDWIVGVEQLGSPAMTRTATLDGTGRASSWSWLGRQRTRCATPSSRRSASDALTLAELRSRLGAPWDRPVGRDDLDRLLQLDTSFTEVSDGFVFVPALVEGTAWTVRVDADDGAEGFVRMHPELSALGWWLIGDDVELVDGDGQRLGVLETDGWMLDGRDTDVVLGPDGWLDGLVGRLGARRGRRGRVAVVAARWAAGGDCRPRSPR